MTQCNALNVKLPNSQILKISSIVADSNDENIFMHKLFLISTQASKLGKAFANGLSANIKL